MANPKLEISSLDFDGIKQNLRNFLNSQREFRDFDFEGPGLTVLIDLLAYNTHYNGFYFNMLANEMFMDSADIRYSVVSRAKHLGYVPRSVRSANAIVDLRITPNDSPANIVVNKNTLFTTTIDNTTYTFCTSQAYTGTVSNGVCILSNVVLIEGIPYHYRYTVDLSDPSQRFIIPNPGVDTSTIKVSIQTSANNNATTVYSLADNINESDGTSTVYWIQETEDQLFEVYFGDGILGKSLQDGNIVIIDYILSSGPGANKASVFAPAGLVGGYSSEKVVVTTVSAAYGGADRETIDQIKFAAPKNYEAQDRAVTVQDYKTLIMRDLSLVDSVAVWGGEDHDPPTYGKVFISLKPVDGFAVTETVKSTVIQNTIKRYNMASIIPEIIDPEYIYILINCKAKYDPAATTKTSSDIANTAKEAILSFSKQEMGKFDRVLKFSKLQENVNNCDQSISSNLITLRMQKRVAPVLNVTDDYPIKFYNAIRAGSLMSSTFVTTQDLTYSDGDIYHFEDDGQGKVILYKASGSNNRVMVSVAGSIDYALGIVTLTQFKPYSLTGTTLNITVIPEENDITPVRNNILYAGNDEITVSAFMVGPTTR